MSAMDVFFTDAVSVPVEEQSFYAEQIRYLPCVVGYFDFDEEAPAVNELPALSGNGITFGSFNRLEKNTEATFCVWSEILKACPGSRMVIKTVALNDEKTRGQVLSRFAREEISPERIILQGGSPKYEHLKAYNQIDIALDPCPHGGGVTALESLRMGVPMVSLRCATLVGRISASILTALGLTDWIANTEQEYIEIALKKSLNLKGLSKIRQRLKENFKLSAIGDPKVYTLAVEQEYRLLWREWCACK